MLTGHFMKFIAVHVGDDIECLRCRNERFCVPSTVYELGIIKSWWHYRYLPSRYCPQARRIYLINFLLKELTSTSSLSIFNQSETRKSMHINEIKFLIGIANNVVFPHRHRRGQPPGG